MFLARVSFRSKSRLTEVQTEAIHALCRMWWDGGQVLSAERPRHQTPLICTRRSAETIVWLPERGALSARHAVSRAQAGLKWFTDQSISIDTEILGRIDDEAPADRCRVPRAYILFSHAYTVAPPVRCADCFQPVPLYRLPPWDTDDSLFNRHYSDLLTWQRDFNAMDRLWFDSSFAERYAFRQFSDPRSTLNRDGLSVRESLEDRLGRKVYYFLFAHCTLDGTNRKPGHPCPICNGKWVQKRDVFTRFHHKCDRCRVVTI
jgi:predicted  nucleic acid-binding Zn ribbon protein